LEGYKTYLPCWTYRQQTLPCVGRFVLYVCDYSSNVNDDGDVARIHYGCSVGTLLPENYGHGTFNVVAQSGQQGSFPK